MDWGFASAPRRIVDVLPRGSAGCGAVVILGDDRRACINTDRFCAACYCFDDAQAIAVIGADGSPPVPDAQTSHVQNAAVDKRAGFAQVEEPWNVGESGWIVGGNE